MPAFALLGLAAMFPDGYFLPEREMGSIPETLGRAVREQDGQIHLHSNVSRILVKNGRVYAMFKRRSPIRGLYQACQTRWPGFGVASAEMSGIMAAEALIRNETP